LLQLYIPLMAALAVRLLSGRKPRQFAASLLGMLWVAAALPLLDYVNVWAGWWGFSRIDPFFGGMPLALYAGWIVLWGAIPVVAFPKMRLRWVAVMMACVDLLVMPLYSGIVVFKPTWLWEKSPLSHLFSCRRCFSRAGHWRIRI